MRGEMRMRGVESEERRGEGRGVVGLRPKEKERQMEVEGVGYRKKEREDTSINSFHEGLIFCPLLLPIIHHQNIAPLRFAVAL